MADNSFGHVNLKAVRFHIGFSQNFLKKLSIDFVRNELNSIVLMSNIRVDTYGSINESIFLTSKSINWKKYDVNHDYHEI